MLFKDRIFQRGKDLYRQKAIRSFEKIGNTYYAKIKGTRLYDVSVTLSSDNEVISMSCTCPYAMDGNNCKHEAALCVAIEKEIKKEEAKQEMINDIHNDLGQDHKNEFIDLFLKYYGKNNRSVSVSNVTKDIKKVLRNFNNKCYTRNYDVNGILALYGEIFDYCTFIGKSTDLKLVFKEICLEFTEYKVTRNKFLKVFEEKIQDDDNTLYHDVIIGCLNLLSIQDKITICLEYLHLINDDNFYFNFLFKNYLTSLNALDLSIEKGLKEISNYKECDIAKLYLAKEAFDNGNIDNAIKLINTIKNPEYQSHEIYKNILKNKYLMNKSHKYLAAVLDSLRNNENIESLVQIVRDLKEIYGDEWSEYECNFYEVALKHRMVTERTVVECLKETDSPIYAFKVLNEAEDIDDYICYQYKYYLKEYYEEMYLYLLKKKAIDCAIKHGKEAYYIRRNLYSLMRDYIYEASLTVDEIDDFVNEVIFYGELTMSIAKELSENVGNYL